MAEFDIEGPDGSVFTVRAETEEEAARAVHKHLSLTSLPNADPDSGDKPARSLDGGIVDTLVEAVKAPGRAYRGELQVFNPDGTISDEAIGHANTLAGIGTPISPVSRAMGVAPKSPPPAKPGQEVAEAGQRVGVDLPRAVTSDSTTVQQVGKNLSSVPVGGTPLRKGSQKAIEQLDDAADTVRQGFGSGSSVRAGEGLRADITDTAKSALPERVAQRYAAVDELVDPSVTSVLSSTKNKVGEITGRRKAAAMTGDSQALKLVEDAINRPEGLTYEGIKDLRTSIGEMLKKPNLMPAGMSQSELKQIYGALTEDLRRAVTKAGGPKARVQFERANKFAEKVARETESLNKIVGSQSDEALVDKLTAMAGSTSRADIKLLRKARSAVSKETWNEFASAVLTKMGRDPEGNFTPERFLTAWGKMSDDGKKAIFGTTGKGELIKAVDDIATVSTRMKSLNQFANPSGTGQTLMTGAMATTAGVAGFLEPMTLLATATGLSGTRLLSTMLAKPKLARQAGAWAKAYQLAVRKPTRTSISVFKNRSKALSLTIANDVGVPASQALGGLVKSVANPEEEQPVEVRDQVERQRPKQERRQLSPFET